MWCLSECLHKEINVRLISELDFVEEVESAAREPGRADEGGLEPGQIGLISKPGSPLAAAGVDDVLPNLDGEATVVHVGE